MEGPSEVLSSLVSSSILYAFAFFGVSLFILYRSSEWFTEGSVEMAGRMGVSKFIIGVIVAGFGTSMPELATSVYAAVVGASGVAVGNAVGSNITNIALVLGLSCLVGSVKVRKEIELREGLTGLGIMLIASAVILHNSEVDRVDGLLLMSVFMAYLYRTLRNKANYREPIIHGSLPKNILFIVVGLGGVLLGSAILVNSAVAIARFFGVPEAVIGLTMVALGTSLPELSVAVVAAKKGYTTLMLGNVLGSNVMNILLVLGAAAIASPLLVEPEISDAAIPMMLLLSLLLVFFMREGTFIRWRQGVLLLALYAVFIWLSFT
jgi:cation:H+ antiporter